MSNNNEHWHSDFGFAGPHATFHCQYFQMVDLITMNCKRTMNGLNPCALTCEPETCDNNTNSDAKEERKVQVEEWIQPKEHESRHEDGNQQGNNVGRKHEITTKRRRIKIDATSCMRRIRRTKKRKSVVLEMTMRKLKKN